MQKYWTYQIRTIIFTK